ncbi:MAG: 3-hydroxyacyl-ACP dehydratase FabZ [Acidimicrobiales bacterium]
MSELSLDPEDWLPHRPPFLLLDTLLAIEPGVRASALWTLTGDEWFFPGHFPGRPTTPGVLLIESIAQCGAVIVLSDERYTRRLPLFGGVERARFRRQIVPGDTVRIECEMTKLSARGGKGFGAATVEGDLAASTELFFVLADVT